MNTGPADTRSPHLDLEDLIAGACGQPVADRARDHLARCEHCRAEARRWDLVARGVRGLAAAAPEAAPPAPPGSRPHVLAGRRRAILAASAAAAILVLAGVGYGVAGVLTRHAPGAVLTAVSGCNGLQLGAGTLEQVNGSSLVLKMAGGRPVTVTTTPSTKVSVAGPLRRDITDGATVVVLGPRAGGAIAAASVTITSSLRGLSVSPPSGWAVASGTVSDAGPAGFTVTTPGGGRVPVTTSGSTFVNVSQASLGQLKAGARTVVVGRPAADGTLAAAGLLQQSPRSGMQVQFHVRVRGCSPGSLAAALDRVLTPGS